MTTSHTTCIPGRALAFLHDNAPVLRDRLHRQIQVSETVWSHLADDEQRAFAAQLVEALVAAVEQGSSVPLHSLMERSVAPPAAGEPCGALALAAMLRESAFATLKPFVIQDPDEGWVALDAVAGMLGGIQSCAAAWSIAATAPDSSRAELLALSTRLDQAFETSPLAAIEFDVEGSIRRWNPSAERIFGWSADEALGKNIFTLIVPDIAWEHVQGILKQLLSGTSANSRNVNVTRDGRMITCQWHNAVLRDEHGQVVGVLSQTEDVTEQEAREERLKTFYALAENMPDAICVTLPDGVITYANPAYQAMFGYGSATIGMRITEFIAEQDQAKLSPALPEMMERGRWQAELMYQRKDRSQFKAQLSSFVVRDTDGQPLAFAAVIRDMSEQLRAEQERIALQEQLISAQQAALRELSTPVIPLSEDVIAMPLVGSIDSSRAQLVIETLLQGVAESRATTAILDITGVQVVDTQVANALLRAAQAVKLLGTQMVITGIRPEVAQTLVGLGLDLSGIVTRSTLQSGIAFALNSRTRLAATNGAGRSSAVFAG